MDNICKIEKCERKVNARGYCSPHYKRWRRAGFTENFNKSASIRTTNDVNGLSRSKMYKLWDGIIRRCENKNHHAYPNYGGRGIKVCKRWRESFNNFYADMGDKPTPQHSIERKDNNGDYTPENCEWATKAEQAQNRRMNPRNTSGYTGISLESGKYWRVTFERDGNRIRKNFTSKDEAIKYRKKLEADYQKIR